MTEKEQMNVDPYSNLKIRKTDNTLKEGDFEAPQDPVPLKLDGNGLPEFAYDHIEGVR